MKVLRSCCQCSSCCCHSTSWRCQSCCSLDASSDCWSPYLHSRVRWSAPSYGSVGQTSSVVRYIFCHTFGHHQTMMQLRRPNHCFAAPTRRTRCEHAPKVQLRGKQSLTCNTTKARRGSAWPSATLHRTESHLDLARRLESTRMWDAVTHNV